MRIKVKKASIRECSGSVVATAMIILGVVGAALAGYLGLVSHHNQSVIRSHDWSLAYLVAEAGVEEAMTQMNFVEDDDFSANGWPLVEGKYTKERTLDDYSYYKVTIDPATYTFTSTSTGTISTVGSNKR